jgi:hypothetical protein
MRAIDAKGQSGLAIFFGNGVEDDRILSRCFSGHWAWRRHGSHIRVMRGHGDRRKRPA